ncbi:MAG: hypothetical protein A3I66_19810 [Burkholderiales bacterium RIFCSPLOWO2_02_FULL_57_36]|nr:MAG: hypothetical protein A3I66_19810 [Burkholderiales bacterium RIFCSPLOWO2_02_FULL_57_36]
MRLLLWGVIIFAIVMLVLHVKKAAIQRRDRGQENPQSPVEAAETMIRCAQCGMHIPASEAVLVQSDLAFCSEEHRLKHFSD